MFEAVLSDASFTTVMGFSVTVYLLFWIFGMILGVMSRLFQIMLFVLILCAFSLWVYDTLFTLKYANEIILFGLCLGVFPLIWRVVRGLFIGFVRLRARGEFDPTGKLPDRNKEIR